ncbi:hypothetical protein ACSBR1_040908 [Camellia fascicularis]
MFLLISSYFNRFVFVVSCLPKMQKQANRQVYRIISIHSAAAFGTICICSKQNNWFICLLLLFFGGLQLIGKGRPWYLI